MKKTATSSLIVFSSIVGCLALIGYVYWFNNFRPARITADDAYSIAKDYLSTNKLNFIITQVEQSTYGPNPSTITRGKMLHPQSK